jgi:hypothetical protein
MRLDAETCAMELVAIAAELQLDPKKIEAIKKILRWQ